MSDNAKITAPEIVGVGLSITEGEAGHTQRCADSVTLEVEKERRGGYVVVLF